MTRAEARMEAPTPAEVALAYHERTKHYPTRFARALGYLDWANQPDPFRRFRGARRVLLPLTAAATARDLPDLTAVPPDDAGPSLDDLYAPRAAAGAPAPLTAPLTAASLGLFFELSLGVTAWKSYQSSRWALRANPSSGNLHPTEGYAILPELAGVGGAGVYHYRSEDHALEERAAFAGGDAIAALGAAPASFIVGLTSIVWREAWKYGERAFRYCQHDLGHAVAALRFAAAANGWEARVVSAASDADVGAILGLDRAGDFDEAEDEEPECLVWIGAGGTRELDIAAWVRAARAAAWTGRANRLSEEHVEWDVLGAVAAATRKGDAPAPVGLTEAVGLTADALPAVAPSDARSSAGRIVRQRRSAVAFDGETSMPASAFFRMLDRTLPRGDAAPFDALDRPAAVDLAIFVHRVEGLDAGLYWLARQPAMLERVRSKARPAFAWARVQGAPPHLPLYLLQRGDFRTFGRSICCDQEIASDGAVNLGMIADFEGPCMSTGAWMYRRLFWETGAVGQVLYLEAENAGLRGTGIGCFFDDEMHGVLGFRTREFQSLYHFAIGKPVDDPRLQTWPAYSEGARSLTPA